MGVGHNITGGRRFRIAYVRSPKELAWLPTRPQTQWKSSLASAVDRDDATALGAEQSPERTLSPVPAAAHRHNQPRHHARDTRAEPKASPGPRVVAHLPFAKPETVMPRHCVSGLPPGASPFRRPAGRAWPALGRRCAREVDDAVGEQRTRQGAGRPVAVDGDPRAPSRKGRCCLMVAGVTSAP